MPIETIFNALSDPTRRRVVERLTQGSAAVSQLAEPFDMALPSFTQHLKVLEESGLVKSEKVGRVRIVELAPQRLEEAAHWLEEQRTMWERRLNQLDNHLMAIKEKK